MGAQIATISPADRWLASDAILAAIQATPRPARATRQL